MKIAFFSFLTLLVLTGTSVLALSKYYGRYEGMEKRLETSFDYDASTANAIKHAKAASDMFRTLRVVIGDKVAEEAVIKLGLLNEYIEQVEYPNDRDTAREIMKDLHNNYVGILAAKEADRVDAFRIILAFADNRTLIVKNIYNPFFDGKEPKQDVVAFGYSWFDQHRSEIDERIEKKLLRTMAFLPAQSIQVSDIAYVPSFVE